MKMCNNINTCHKIKEQFIDELLLNLEARFPQSDTDLVTAFSCLGLCPISFLSPDELKVWGNDKIQTLCDKYGKDLICDDGTIYPAIVDPYTVHVEWKNVKTCVKDNSYPRTSTANLWSLLKQYHHSEFPQLIKLAMITLVLPVHTSDCERSFSTQNQLKTPSRNRITSEHLDLLMQINVNGPEKKDYDFTKALKLWKNSKKRRLYNYKHLN